MASMQVARRRRRQENETPEQQGGLQVTNAFWNRILDMRSRSIVMTREDIDAFYQDAVNWFESMRPRDGMGNTVVNEMPRLLEIVIDAFNMCQTASTPREQEAAFKTHIRKKLTSIISRAIQDGRPLNAHEEGKLAKLKRLLWTERSTGERIVIVTGAALLTCAALYGIAYGLGMVGGACTAATGTTEVVGAVTAVESAGSAAAAGTSGSAAAAGTSGAAAAAGTSGSAAAAGTSGAAAAAGTSGAAAAAGTSGAAAAAGTSGAAAAAGTSGAAAAAGTSGAAAAAGTSGAAAVAGTSGAAAAAGTSGAAAAAGTSGVAAAAETTGITYAAVNATAITAVVETEEFLTRSRSFAGHPTTAKRRFVAGGTRPEACTGGYLLAFMCTRILVETGTLSASSEKCNPRLGSSGTCREEHLGNSPVQTPSAGTPVPAGVR
ncbi:hypothetical protein Bbelb_016430 [Branchiostoma belcheri]|nr:hypothetical protein Bbelb_016430 [Branchiostoma belcheri]